MKYLIALWLCLLMNVSLAQTRPWTDEEVKLGVTALTLHALDFSQTSYAMKHGYKELNPLLGSHPSDGKLISAFLLSTVVMYYIIDQSEDNRKEIMYTAIGIKLLVVGRHALMGIHIPF